jgi:hypothetical protein
MILYQLACVAIALILWGLAMVLSVSGGRKRGNRVRAGRGRALVAALVRGGSLVCTVRQVGGGGVAPFPGGQLMGMGRAFGRFVAKEVLS